jgi:hypothetical protein
LERHFKHNLQHAHEGGYVRCTIRRTIEERSSEGARTTSELRTQETDPPPFQRRVVADEGKDWLEWTSRPSASVLQHGDQREPADTCSTPKARPAKSIQYFPARRQHRRKSIDFRYGLPRRTQQPLDVGHRANIAGLARPLVSPSREPPSEGNAENTDQQGSVSWPFSSVRFAAINVAAISTSASQPKAARLRFPHAALTGVGQRGRNYGCVLPRSSTAWTVFENRRAIGCAYNLPWAGRIPSREGGAYPPITSSGE